MHYGHPDVFDRVFHITRGGISKASRVINISEDIYSGMSVDFASWNFGCSDEEATLSLKPLNCVGNLVATKKKMNSSKNNYYNKN